MHSREKLSNDEFILRAKSVHGDKYDYSLVNYVNNRTKVCIICPEHGEFWQSPNSHHLSGSGCPKCGHSKAGKSKRLTKETFIEKSRKVHGDKYDYSKVEYVNNSTKVCIICPIHGEFWQTPDSHMLGSGCRACGYEKNSRTQTRSNEEFIEKAKAIHGNKYDYSNVNYINSRSKVCIICPEHGEFWQIANDHLRGHGCPKCKADKHRNSQDDFITRAIKVHGNKYNYDKVVYKHVHEYVIITCPIHGDFEQIPLNHLRGSGCYKCYLEELSKSKKLLILKIL